ncbi:hypothetical protein MYX76_16410 [Desulfobacterota bacterium AH_259_B03_O07]|nr:hypothetical protein [Desulfobacterota bacterium AH_259_B03_O07]
MGEGMWERGEGKAKIPYPFYRIPNPAVRKNADIDTLIENYLMFINEIK